MNDLFVPFETLLETQDGDEEIAPVEEMSSESGRESESGGESGSESESESESESTTTRGSAARVLAAREKKVCPDGVVQEYAIQQQQGDEESWVSGEGGSSSSSSTTMIKTKDGDMEW